MHRLIFCLVSLISFLSVKAQTFSWAHGSGTWVTDTSNKIISDADGNFYITGHVYSGATFGTFQAPDWGFYITKYDAAGNILWARFGGGAYNGTGVALAVDSEGSVYATGHFSHALQLGDTLLQGSHQSKVFLVKYTSSGQLDWAKNLGLHDANGWPGGSGLAVDKDDNVYITGNVIGTLTLENGVIIKDPFPGYYGSRYFFLAKYSKEGRIQWGKGGKNLYGESFSVDLVSGTNNDIYLAAQIGSGNEFKFGTASYTKPFQDAGSVILNINSSGDVIWKSFITSGISDIEVNEKGQLFSCGLFSNSVSFDNHTLVGSPTTFNFIVKYETDKTVGWSKKIDSYGGWYPYIAEHKGNIYVAGTFNGSVQIDSLALTYSGRRDGFVLKISEFGYAQWIKHISSGWVDLMNSITVNQNGVLAITGEYSGATLNLDGIELINNSGNNDEDIFIAAFHDNTPLICPSFDPVLKSDTIICSGGKALLQALNTHNYPVSWYQNAQPDPRVRSSVYDTQDQGDYYFVLFPNTVCADTSNKVRVSVVPYPEADLQAEPGFETCDGEPILLEIENDPDYSYRWYVNDQVISGETSHSFLATQSGQYRASVTNKGLCTSTIPNNEVRIILPENDFLPDSLWHCNNELLEILPSTQHTGWLYAWSTGESTSAIEVKLNGTYELTLTQGGCKFIDHVVVEKYPDLWMPNVITPNQDGKNDLFVIKNSVAPVALTIYNLWGQPVYTNNDYESEWPQVEITSGVYYYIVKGRCDKEGFKGWLQIIDK